MTTTRDTTGARSGPAACPGYAAAPGERRAAAVAWPSTARSRTRTTRAPSCSPSAPGRVDPGRAQVVIRTTPVCARFRAELPTGRGHPPPSRDARRRNRACGGRCAEARQMFLELGHMPSCCALSAAAPVAGLGRAFTEFGRGGQCAGPACIFAPASAARAAVPHKPLLVLLALGRLAATGSSELPWTEAG